MPMVMDTNDNWGFTPAKTARMAYGLGGGIRGLIDASQARAAEEAKQQAIGEATAYASSGQGYEDDPETFAAKIVGIIGRYGGTPGPVVKSLVDHKSRDWEARQKKVEAQAKQAQEVQRALTLVDKTQPAGSPEGYDWVPTPQEATMDEDRQIAATLAIADPQGYVKGVRERLMAKPEKAPAPHAVSPGQVLVDSATGRVIYQAPERTEKPKETLPPGLRLPEGWAWDDKAQAAYEVTGYVPKPEKPKGGESPLAKLIADRNALPEGSPDRKIFDRAIQKATQDRPGLRVKTNADGTVEVSEGLVEPTKPTQGKVEQSILDTGATLQRLSLLEKDFNKNLQQAGPRLGAWWATVKDKGGVQLNASEKLNLQRITVQRKRAYDVLNNELNRLSGAAVSDQELKRLVRGLPNAGTGILDGDSPEEFDSKLKASARSIRLAMARYAYVRKKGLSIGNVELEQMPELMERRGKEIEAELRLQGVVEKNIRDRTRSLLADEFGLIR